MASITYANPALPWYTVGVVVYGMH